MGLPTLDTTGVITDNDEIMVRLFLNFMAAEEAQTYFYSGHVCSLKFLIVDQSASDSEFIDNMESALESMYKRYFDTVDVTVTLVSVADLTTYDVGIEINTTKAGTGYTLAKAVKLENGTLAYTDINLEELKQGK